MCECPHAEALIIRIVMDLILGLKFTRLRAHMHTCANTCACPHAEGLIMEIAIDLILGLKFNYQTSFGDTCA